MKAVDQCILAFDLGTTNLKAGLYDLQGRLLHIVRQPFATRQTSGRCEVTLASFYEQITFLVKNLSVAHDLSTVVVVSFSSQANSFALFDEHDEPLTPIIVWTDARASGIDQPLNSLADLHDCSGVPSVDHEFAQAKLRWLARHEPNIARDARKISFISDILVEWMTGKHQTECGLACLTALADRKSQRWSADRVDMLGVPNLIWPEIVSAGTHVGPLVPETAKRLGLPSSARFYMGCLDQYAGAIGTGAATLGGVCETTGTVLAVVQCVESRAPTLPEVFVGPSFSRDRQFRMTFSSTSANLLEWFRLTQHPKLSFAELVNLAVASQRAACVNRVTLGIENAFLPHDLAGPPGPVVRGIMDRVCDELASLVVQLQATGLPVRSAGGAARSDDWLQMKANRLGVNILASSTEEPACLGAAMLAASGIGIGTLDDLSTLWCRPRRVFFPDKEVPCQHPTSIS